MKSSALFFAALLVLTGCSAPSGSTNAASSEAEIEAENTTTAEPEVVLLTKAQGCSEFSSMFGRLSRLTSLALDTLRAEDSTAFLAPDFKDIADELGELALEVEDADLQEALQRMSGAIDGFSAQLGAEEFPDVEETQLAVFELESVCPDL